MSQSAPSARYSAKPAQLLPLSYSSYVSPYAHTNRSHPHPPQDEIDALATSRTASDTPGGAHEGVLTSLLNEMDGVQELVGVTIVAATNRPEAIDSALMRPGRLDRILYVGPPDAAGREEILRIRTAGMAVEPGLDYAWLTRMVRRV